MNKIVSRVGLSGHRLPDIRQAEAAECGLACLTMISCYHRRRISLNTLRHQYPVSMKGMTLKSLMETAEKLGFISRPLRLESQPAYASTNASHSALGHDALRGT
ncbi:cysteine peptidase family C39 domain-containing protein [Methylobacterium sp. P31]